MTRIPSQCGPPLEREGAAKTQKMPPAVKNHRRHRNFNAGQSPAYCFFSVGFASAFLVESGLSFLGIGVQPPNASWGNILTDGKANIEIAWWLSLFPGFAILLTVLGYNLLGEGLRDWLDPRNN